MQWVSVTKFNPIQEGGGGGAKSLPTSFSPVILQT